MAITNIDLSDNTFVLQPMRLTDDAETLLTAIVENIQYDKTTFENANAEIQAKVNEVVNDLNTLTAGTSVDLQALQDKINAILLLQSEAGTDSFVGLFSKLYDVLNDRKEVLTQVLNVTSTTNGTVLVDLSAYNFKDITSYEVVPSVLTKSNGVNVSVTFEKIDNTTGKLTIRNLAYIQSVNVPQSYYDPTGTNKDGTVNGALDILLTIIRVPRPISAEITEADGDVTRIGTPEVPSAIISSVVTGVDGIVTITGSKGTELNTIISITNPEPSIVFTVNSVDGEDLFTIVSNSAALKDSSLYVNKSVNGVDAYPVLVNYTSIYPQITSDMVVIDDVTQSITITSTTLANLTANISIDGGVVSQYIFDATGTVTTSDFAAILGDTLSHTVRITVTNTDGLESLPLDITYQKIVASNANEI